MATLRLTCDDSTLRRKCDAIMAALPDAAREALTAVMGAKGVMGDLVKVTPVDTGRMKNAFHQAAREARLDGMWPPVTISPSKYTQSYIDRLHNQVKGLARVEAYLLAADSSWATSKGVKTGAMRPSAARRLRKVRVALEKSRADLLNLKGTDILMKSGDGRLREYSTRSKVYGGAGYLYRQGGSWFVTIVNKEPHALTVDRLNRNVAFALARAKAFGVRRHGAPAMLAVLKKVAA